MSEPTGRKPTDPPPFWEMAAVVILFGLAFWFMNKHPASAVYGGGTGLLLFLGRLLDWQRSTIRRLEERLARLEARAGLSTEERSPAST
jgi:predicted lysophospholipase L1 biosynthesis ABC-type transport system permease subunit